MDYTPILNYVNEYWSRITYTNTEERGTLIGLPYPYLVPNTSDGNMFQEMYYWDSYFIALGVVGTEHEQRIIDMTENMAYLFNRFGLIPNGSRYYFLSRSQPPVLTLMIDLAYEVKKRRGDADADAFLARLTEVAEREQETVWLGTKQPHHRLVHKGLSRYFDINYLDIMASCESGWDHSTRCDGRWLEHLPVDLNSILYARELAFACTAEKFGQAEKAQHWQARAAQRAQTMQELMWDEAEGFFFDYDFKNERRNPDPSLAGFFPLWAGLATPEQATRIVKNWLPRFELPGGLVTTLKQEAGKQWAYPNGWAPLQWFVVEGLDRYGFSEDARRLRKKWCDNCATLFAATGVMWEKYNVVHVGGSEEEGLYGSVKGFGWSNGVFVDFARKLIL
jgi:alpha,alpha-trehalase